jgi:hypothetical protein
VRSSKAAGGSTRSLDCIGHHQRGSPSLNLEATPRNAALAGVWSALGLIPFEAWAKAQNLGTAAHNTLWLVVVSMFLLVPAFLFVMGPWWQRAEFKQQFTRAYWVEFGKLGVRVLCWLLSAGTTGAILAVAEKVASAT